ncbi:HDOD domain-containing protein [Bacterioplanoides sp.]|uniref:HDOD domain-containing protein n=1 Tax=Bacterioplanoides sp. TaxID=2066072 RepID=UPI003B00D36C
MTTQLLIPSRPDLLLEIQNILAQPDPEPADVVELIKRDVGLYTVLLAAVNSPLYRREFLIESAEHAVAILGMTRVANLVRVVALRSSVDPDGQWQSFWEVSTEIATLCQQLSVKLHCLLPDNAYTLGMMHNIGVPLMRARWPDYDTQLASLQRDNAVLIRRAELAAFDTNRFQAAGLLAKEWFMADELVDALQYQAHAQAALMGKAQVSDAVLQANALLLLAKDISQEYQNYWHFDSDDTLSPLVVRALKLLNYDQYDYLDLKEDLLQQLARSESAHH